MFWMASFVVLKDVLSSSIVVSLLFDSGTATRSIFLNPFQMCLYSVLLLIGYQF